MGTTRDQVHLVWRRLVDSKSPLRWITFETSMAVARRDVSVRLRSGFLASPPAQFSTTWIVQEGCRPAYASRNRWPSRVMAKCPRSRLLCVMRRWNNLPVVQPRSSTRSPESTPPRSSHRFSERRFPCRRLATRDAIRRRSKPATCRRLANRTVPTPPADAGFSGLVSPGSPIWRHLRSHLVDRLGAGEQRRKRGLTIDRQGHQIEVLRLID